VKLDETADRSVTIDTYRIAAVRQLKKYGRHHRALRCGFVQLRPRSCAEAVHQMRDCRLRADRHRRPSPKDALKLNELRTFLEAASPERCTWSSRDRGPASVDLAIEKFATSRGQADLPEAGRAQHWRVRGGLRGS